MEKKWIMMAMMPVAVSAQDPFFYIFLCIGQSNMVGQGEISDADRVVEDEGFLSLSAVDGPDGRKVGQWRKAVPPLCRANTGMSLVDFFGQALRKNLRKDVRIGVIHVAVDGCAIDLFDKDACEAYVKSQKADWMLNEIAAYDGNPYKRLVDMARLAQKEGVIRGILLHQGETDAYNEQWLEKVKKVYGDLMTDLNLDPTKVPLVAGEAVGADQKGVCAHANPIINRLPEVLPNSYVASSEGCQAGADHLHFTTEGYRTLGTRYAMKMMQAMGYKEMHDGYETGPKQVAAPVEDFDVDGNIDSKGILHATATAPIDRIEYVSFSGNVLKTVPMNGVKTADVDMTQYPAEKRLVVVFYSKGGASVSFDYSAQ